MSQLLTLRQAVIDAIKVALPTFTVEGHLGRFTAAELTRFFVAAPAVRVAVLGLSESAEAAGGDTDDGPAVDAVARLAVYVVTKDGLAKLSRDEAAVAAVERIVLTAVGARWGLTFARPARPATAQNLYSDETLSKGVALWAIDIQQPVQLTLPGEGEFDPLGQLFVGLAPKIGPAHVNDYLGPFPAEPA